MNSFVENVNYVANLDNKYGRSVEIFKNNLSLRTESYNVNIKFTYYNNETKELVDIDGNYNTVDIAGFNAMLLNFKSQILGSAGGNTFTCDSSFTYTNFIINNVGIVNLKINSLNDNIKTYGLNISISSGLSKVYNINGSVSDTLKILPSLALINDEVINNASIIADNVLNIENIVDNITNIAKIGTVSDNINDVVTVADNIADVVTVGDNIASVNATGDNIVNVGIVSDNILDVGIVAGSILNVNAVGTDIANVNSVAVDLTNVDIVAGSIANVNITGNNIADVNTVSYSITNVNTVSGSIGNVNTTSANITGVNTVSNNIGNVNVVANNIVDVGIVANVSTDVTTVADSITSVNVIANDLELAGFSNVSDYGTLDGIVEVAPTGVSLVEVVADGIVEVLAVGTNIANVNSVASNETNINAVVSDVIPNMSEILLADDRAASALASANSAYASEALAHKWAQEQEDVVVAGTIGIDEEYSAYHWAKKAEAAIGGNITLDSLYDVDIDGMLNGGTIVWNQSLGKYVAYDFAHNDVLGLDLTAGVTVSTGQIAWNSDEGTADLGLPNGSTLQIGQENIRTVRNATASAISNGTLCMFDGTIVNSGRIKVKPFTAGFNDAMYLYGVATQNITSGSDGIITIEGKVRGIDTTGASVGEVWADEDILYAKPNDNGAMTNVIPADNELRLVVATVIHAHATNGVLEIRFTPLNENMYYTKVQNDILLNSKVPLDGDFTLDLGGL